MEEKLEIKIPKPDCPCKKCIWALDFPNNLNCGKFRVKPSNVFYDSEECPKFEEIEFDPDEETDYE